MLDTCHLNWPSPFILISHAVPVNCTHPGFQSTAQSLSVLIPLNLEKRKCLPLWMSELCKISQRISEIGRLRESSGCTHVGSHHRPMLQCHMRKLQKFSEYATIHYWKGFTYDEEKKKKINTLKYLICHDFNGINNDFSMWSTPWVYLHKLK